MSGELVGGGVSDVQVDMGNGAVVSMQTVQHIYNEITGRAEELARAYSVSHCTTFEDIKQLNVKISQMYEQYNILSKNSNVTLFHVDDQRQTFSSFERFELYDRSTLSPVENIRMVYNFLIVLPQVNKPQSYRIEINIQSRAAISQRIAREAPGDGDFIFRIMEERTAHVEIQYIDYTVARTFQVAIDSWFKGLGCTVSSGVIGYLKRMSDNFSFIFRILSSLIFLLVCIYHAKPILEMNGGRLDLLYVSGAVTFGGMYLVAGVSAWFGAIVGDSIRRVRALSYLRLTRGDEIAIEEMKDRNSRSWARGMLSTVAAVIVNIFSGWLATSVGM